MSRGRNTKRQLCAACEQSVPTNGHGLFMQHACPMKGADAFGGDYKVCPEHGGLVWTLGPYSAYRICGGKGKDCRRGTGGKPWRYFSPKTSGEAKEATPVEPPPAPWNGWAHERIETPTPATEWKRAGEWMAEADYPDIEPATPKAEPKSTPMPVDAITVREAGIDLKNLGSLGDAIQSYVDARASEIATNVALDAITKLAEGAPSKIEWTVNGEAFAAIDGTHHVALPRMLKLYAAGFRNFLVVGPAGSGKTTLASNFASALKLAYGSVGCTSGMSESKLIGRAIPNITSGEVGFQSTVFIDSYENGGVFLIDEVDAADPNVMLVINGALANGHMSIPDREATPSATRHKDCVIVCAANTWGTGPDRQYVGRNQLDAAFLDRFVGTTIEVDYDRDLESALVGDARICARVWEVRSKVQDLKLRRIVGTRFLLSVTRLVKCAGETLNEALMACTTGWTVDERSKAGVR